MVPQECPEGYSDAPSACFDPPIVRQALSRRCFSPSDLSSLQVSQQAAKCIPAMVCPELTEQIRREVAASLHQRKGDFTCYFLTDLVTFTLPAGQKGSHSLLKSGGSLFKAC